MAKLDLDVALDLGSDTVKVVYSYKNASGIAKLGQLSLGNTLSQIGFPSMAFYDEKKNNWLYCNQVEESGEEDFTTVVRIKSLMELKKKNEDATVEGLNRKYYESYNYFPKFYLPSERTQMDDFDKLVISGHTFMAKGWTPKMVCEGFFAYMKKVIDERIAELEKKEKSQFSVRYSLVYPANVGTEYVDEAERLLEFAFKEKPYRSVNTTKAIGYAAYKKGLVKKNERFLVFDLGEEYISVAKAWVDKNGRPFVDGVEGHKMPERLGGIEIDETIRKCLLNEISSKETFGTPSFDKKGHVNEDCAKAKLYQLLSYIKSAKIYLGEGEWEEDEEIPLYICQDVYVRSCLTRNKMSAFLGLKGERQKDAIAEKLINYVVEEFNAPINEDVTKIVLAGGVMETYGLSDYIVKKVGEALKSSKLVWVFQTVGDKQDEFSIEDNQAVYAAAMGGALAANDGLDFTTVLSLSYGVWERPKADGARLFSFVASKGAELNKKGDTPFLNCFSIRGITDEIEEKLYSMNLSREDVANRKGEDLDMELYQWVQKKNFSQWYLIIDEAGSKRRKRLERPNVAGFKTLVGLDAKGNDVNAQLYYRGEQVRIKFLDEAENLFSIREGIIAQRDGRARVVIENNREENEGRYVYVAYRGPKGGWGIFDRSNPIELSEIEIRFPKTEISLEEN